VGYACCGTHGYALRGEVLKTRHTSSPRGTPLVKRKTRCTIVRCTLFGSKKIRNKRLEKIEFGKMLWKIIRKVGDLVEDGL